MAESEISENGFIEVTTPMSDMGIVETILDLSVDADSDESEDEDVNEDGDASIEIGAEGEEKKKRKKKKAKGKKHKKEEHELVKVAKTTAQLGKYALDAMRATEPHVAHPSIKRGEWATGLCNCFDHMVPNCCMATFCPCFSIAQVASRVGLKYQTVLLAMLLAVAAEWLLYIITLATLYSSESVNDYYYSPLYGRVVVTSRSKSVKLKAWGYIAIVIMLVVFGAFWQLRSRVREQFAIPGSGFEDLLVTCCCSCCALAQMATHVKSYTPGSCAFGPPDELPAYEI